MVTRAKKWLIASAVVCVALGVALCVTVTHIAYANKDNSTPCVNKVVKSKELAEYVLQGVKSTVSNYNKTFNVDWAATSVEYICDISILDLDADDMQYMDGVYVDLDGDNGYFVMAKRNERYTMYSVHIRGDLDFLRSAYKISYEPCSGFIYMNSNGCCRVYQQRDYDYDHYDYLE